VSVVLITGTSTGIGLQTALAAASAGHTVADLDGMRVQGLTRTWIA